MSSSSKRAPSPPKQELKEVLDEVRRIRAESEHLVTGAMAGAYSSVFRGSGIEVHEVREYEDGDDPRTVDWSLTAKAGKLFVKEFVEERELTLSFLLDLSTSMDAGFSHWSPRQMAARLCACLALSAIKNDDRVGLVAFSEGIDRYVPARKGLRHALRIVRDCLATKASGQGTELSAALDFGARSLRRHSILFVMSDFFAEGYEHSLRLCAMHHDVVAVRIFPRELIDPPTRGLFRLRDPESLRLELIDFGHEASRRRLLDLAMERKERQAKELRRAGADLMDVWIPRGKDHDAVARPVLEFFRKRERRRARRSRRSTGRRPSGRSSS